MVKKSRPARPASSPPKAFQRMRRQYPSLVSAYESFSDATLAAGPLDERTARLIKFAVAIGARQEGAAHAAIRKALGARVPAQDLYHAAILAMPTVGFPTGTAAVTWIDDVVAAGRRP